MALVALAAPRLCPPPSQLLLDSDAHVDEHRPSSEQLLSVLQLAPFASQHHMSEYNCIKFGVQGSPVQYLPLSVHMPLHYETLQQRKTSSESQQQWWPCPHAEPPILGPCAAPVAAPPPSLLEEISDAMSSSLQSAPRPPVLPPPPLDNPTHRLKTSSSHPINISAMIPTELIPIISCHLSYSMGQLPIMFDIPPWSTLDRLICNSSPPIPPTPAYPLSLPLKAHMNIANNVESAVRRSSVSARGISRTRSSVSKKLQAALNSRISAVAKVIDRDPPPIPGLPDIRAAISRSRSTSSIPPPISASKNKLSLLHPPPSAPQRSLSDSLLVSSAPPSPRTANGLHSSSSPQDPMDDPPIQSTVTLGTEGSPPSSMHSSTSSLRVRDPSMPVIPGNLYLSSCPGKKVRLDGPVKGRSGVCRDVEADLLRIRQLGVRCIICCLDDDELDFLGVPWSEYCQAAQTMGLDVLRIPTPEGLAPLTPVNLDAHLTQLIDTYTLKGIPMLVHCRGGVGRAGVFACAWMIKLGLCGWIETDVCGGPSDVQSAVGLIRRDTIQLIGRVISVVRRRRSVKAVETYEQVKFLVDYVELLRSRSVRF